jgi:ribosomal protein S18 acetylase RimI-like enzyme
MPDDSTVLSQVGTHAFREAYSPHAGAADIESHIEKNFSVAAVNKVFAAGQSRYYLASVTGEPAGLARVHMAHCPVPGVSANALELQQLYVLARMRRMGLGRRLVDQVVAHAEMSAADGVWLSAWEFADWAVHFYKGVGFTAIGKVEFKLGATVQTDLLMWRPL